MALLKLIKGLGLIALISIGSAAHAEAAETPGPSGPEAAPFRRQEWRVPTQEKSTLSHAVLFQPDGAGPFRLAIIAHASTQNAISRAQMSQPDYRTLASVLVARGFAVLVPERPGHGATGGPYLEDQGGCDHPNYKRAGQAVATSISAALSFMRTQPFIAKQPPIIVGHSAGGWGALAMTDQSSKDIGLVIAFAPGRGGHANDRPGQVCAPDRLIATAAEFGARAKVPVAWLVAHNDSYFPPALSRQMAETFRTAGTSDVRFQILPSFGGEGHWFVEQALAPDLAALLDQALSAPTKATTVH